MIRSELPGQEYQELRSAFIDKYGRPVVTAQQYQNKFGAKLTGERLRWKNSVSQISIGEMDATSNNTLLTIWHNALLKEVEAAGAVKDPTKDL
jgi:hypothetical protein